MDFITFEHRIKWKGPKLLYGESNDQTKLQSRKNHSSFFSSVYLEHPDKKKNAKNQKKKNQIVLWRSLELLNLKSWNLSFGGYWNCLS